MAEIKTVECQEGMDSQSSDWQCRQQRITEKWQRHRPAIFAGILLSAAPSNEECMMCDSLASVKYAYEFTLSVPHSQTCTS